MSSASPRGVRGGGVVVVAGTDGSGKSTLCDALAGSGLAGEVLRVHSMPGVLPRRGDAGPVTEPHRHAPYPAWLAALKTVYLWADALLGWAGRVRPVVARGGWVVIERGWWDHAVDPRRYRLRPAAPLVRILGRLLPRADVLLICDADAAVAASRKAELPAAEIERQRRAWRSTVPRSQPVVRLDAAKPADDVVRDALEAIAHARAGRGWVAFPSKARARWWVPRAPARAAAAGLRVYHPVTPRGLVAWVAARVAARAGLLRFLPRADAPSPAVEAAARAGIDGPIAFARANHPGRFVVLSDAAVAKVATDREGRDALAREAAAVRAMGPALRPPLRAPALRGSNEGALWFEPVRWRPRIRPWTLPADVAASLAALAPGAHGDVAPWNLLRSRDGWTLIDWEEAAEQAAPFHDLFHFLVQGHALLRRPSRRSLVAGLHGRGWVGRAIEAYARAARLDPADARAWFRAYLDESEPRQRADADGRRGAVARARLRSSIEVAS